GARAARRAPFRSPLADETSERGDRDIHVADASPDKVWPVIAESAAEGQLVSDDDDARLAIWVAGGGRGAVSRARRVSRGRIGGSVAAGKLVRGRPETTSPPLAVIVRRVPAQLHV